MKQFDGFGLDTRNECLWKEGAQISLPPKPFAVLRYLVENSGRLITHDELLEALWPETYVQPQVLRTYMLDLRRVLGDDAGQPRFIQTLPKRGYCFVAAIVETEADSVVPAHPSPAPARPALARPAVAIPEARATTLIGRDEELAQLSTLIEAASQGQRRIVFISGEAGIGKTALIEAVSRQPNNASILQATGQCIEGFGAREDYYPVMEILGQLCASAEGERACRVLADMAPSWLATARRDPQAGTESQQAPTQQAPTHHTQSQRPPAERMPGDLCAALEELAATRPLMLIFEDLHWSDEATLHLISALARRRAPARLIVLATFRAHPGATEQPLKSLQQDLSMRKLCTAMVLQPLAKTAMQQLLIRELKQDALPAGLSSFVHQHSEGNPLFAIAILEHLIAQRFLICEGTGSSAHWKERAPFQEMEAGVPDGLVQMLELEIARLTPEEQHMLEAGSLLSVAFPAWAVAAALKKDAADIEEACDDLSRRLYFLQRGGEDDLPDGTHSAFYVFSHGLYREVLYQRQSATCRAKRHTRIAECLGELFAGREANVAREMAVHYEAAANWQRAVQALRVAAHHARQRQAHAEAAELLEHILRLSGHLDERHTEAAAQELRSELMQARGALQ